MYVCGITPYDSTHLGHAATYLTYDLLIRRLEDLGHEVRMVRNITDVDDSILPKARELGYPVPRARRSRDGALPQRHGRARDASAGRRTARDRIGRRASSTSSGALLESGHAYLTAGTAYFDVSTFDRFGELSHYDEDQMVRLARARGGNPDDPHRRAPLDFVLWQPSLADEPAWRAPFGVGPPRLAHRVLGDGDARARPDARPARWRHRPHLPAPRVARSRRAKRSPASRSSTTGCTRRWSTTRARRCRSRSATSCSSATC